MVKGLYTSALGMLTQMQRMDIIADNLANVNTTGFKRDKAAVHSFSEELLKRIDDPSDQPRHIISMGGISQGVFIDDIYTVHESGALRKTGGSLDMAVVGDGFFTVEIPGEDDQATRMYTRDGSFTLDAEGNLITKEGSRVLGEGGVISIPQGVVTISDEGRIYSNQVYVDTLRMTSFQDTRQLRKQGDNMFSAIEGAEEGEFTGKITQGFLEASNVNPIREMTEMITVSRAYDANQRMIVSHDAIMSRTVNDIARK
ncbi:MAG: flagellar basal-body rod protein FlgF [Clostridiales bacterium]|jgi:flagellar basal-body rod protein FlgG|nr:flagellar basal-body rod protein FlgF [Clostridiales bacterium]